MAQFLRQVALVSEVQALSFSELTRTAAALQKQAIRDLSGIWDVQATVDAFHQLEDSAVDHLRPHPRQQGRLRNRIEVTFQVGVHHLGVALRQ